MYLFASKISKNSILGCCMMSTTKPGTQNVLTLGWIQDFPKGGGGQTVAAGRVPLKRYTFVAFAQLPDFLLACMFIQGARNLE